MIGKIVHILCQVSGAASSQSLSLQGLSSFGRWSRHVSEVSPHDHEECHIREEVKVHRLIHKVKEYDDGVAGSLEEGELGLLAVQQRNVRPDLSLQGQVVI